jgi:tetratricopeptide (TPR) repeat protein
MTAMVSKSIEAAEEGRLSELNSHLNALRLVSPEQDGAGMLALASALSVLGSMGRFDAAKSVLTEHFLASEPANDKAPLAQAWANAVDAYQQTFTHEDPWKGLQNAGAALSVFRDAGDLAGAALSRVSCGMNYWCLGLLERAEHELRETPTGGEQLGHISSLRSGWLAGVLADRGALEEAHREATRLVETARERKAGSDEGRGRWVLAEILRRAGELDEAEREASMAVSLLRSAPLDELAATATLSAIWLDQRRTSEAATNAAAVMLSYEAFRAFGYRGAYARLVYAKALHAVGAHDSAREAVAIARARLLANAAKIGDADVRTGFLRNVPENARTLELAREWLGTEGRS